MNVAPARIAASPPLRVGRRIEVRGRVQGVGFRPFIYRQATALGLAGFVANTPSGVTIEATGRAEDIDALLAAIASAPPANAAIVSVVSEAILPDPGERFAVRPSAAEGAADAEVPPDLATCPDCLAELFDPASRRHLYPFTTCSQCGPRYSLIESLPYDRARTAMRHFPLCPACQAEYDNPSDRRFHAESTACPVCGPYVCLKDSSGRSLASSHEAIRDAAEALREGRIVAVKGIGGFHLMCDATDAQAVARLRTRKHRPDKPFAVMAPGLDALADECEIAPPERDLLTSPAAPIVLVRCGKGAIADAVAPGNPLLGVMLAYTPLHHLLLRALGRIVVATSGNLGGDPIAIDDADALARLGGVADLFLVHDRPILRPADDSVVRMVAGRALVLRRGRGYAPAAIPVDGVRAGTLAVGAHFKATVAVTRPGEVVLGPHIGDLDSVETRLAHRRAVGDLAELHGVSPRQTARDLHPDYASSLLAEQLGQPCLAVQHHLAHVVSCLADNDTAPPALGVAWDGTGLGTDGTSWGGEFIAIDAGGWKRVAHLRTFPLPGGDTAAREPRRAALGLLYEAFGAAALSMTVLAPVAAFAAAERGVIGNMLARGVNSPRCSSMGRLFDAVAALIGLNQRCSYEGQAASALEWIAAPEDRGYEFLLRDGEEGALILDWQPVLEAILADLGAGVAPAAIAGAFHAALARAIVAVAGRIGLKRVALTGGCFQNGLLTDLAVTGLRAAGFAPLWHRRVPPNDGGIALGQAVWASWSR